MFEILRAVRERGARARSAELRARLASLLGTERLTGTRVLRAVPARAPIELLPTIDHVPVDRTPLTEHEAANVAQALRALPAFPQSALNGCQSRAHVTYLHLDRSAPGKLHKVWLFTEQLVSATAAQSSIDFVVPGSRTSHWNYHVAVAYRTADGQTMVIDRLTSAEPQTLDSWVHHFEYRGSVALTFTAGRRYSFFLEPRTTRGMSGDVLAGFFDYTGVTRRSCDGAKAIAADALAAAFSRGECAPCAWSRHRADTLSLVAEIAPYLPVPTWSEAVAMEWAEYCDGELDESWSISPLREAPPHDCRQAFQIFLTQLEVWSAMGL